MQKLCFVRLQNSPFVQVILIHSSTVNLLYSKLWLFHEYLHTKNKYQQISLTDKLPIAWLDYLLISLIISDVDNLGEDLNSDYLVLL